MVSKRTLYTIISFVFMGILVSMEGMVNKSLSLYFDHHLSYFVSVDGSIIIIAVTFNYLYRFIAARLTLKNLSLITYGLFIILLSCVLLVVHFKLLILYSIFMLLIGIPTGLIYPLLNNILFLDSPDTEKHFKKTCFANAFWSVGFFIGSYVVNFIDHRLGLNEIYIFMTSLATFMLIFSLIILEKNQPLSTLSKKTVERYKSRLTSRELTMVVLVCLSFALLTTFQSLYTYWMPNYIKSLSNLKPSEFGLIIGAFGSGQFFTRLLFGVFYKSNRDISKFIVIALSCVFLTSLSLSLIISFHGLLIICFLLGLFSGPLLPAIISDVMRFSKHNAQKMVSNIILAGTIGNIISVLFSSFLFYKISLHYIVLLIPIAILSGTILYFSKNKIKQAV